MKIGNTVEFIVSVKENELVRVMLEHNADDNTQEVYVKFVPNTVFDLYDLIRNDVLMENIGLDEVKKMISKIERYGDWLHNIYEPKWGHVLNEFFYQVYLWIREDLQEFCIYTGATLNYEDNKKA